ncbi:MAG: accessory gene regulator B family protein [Clostridia bacterium]|nr:accessory gene regulator B family protein [Clostridia bacterium]
MMETARLWLDTAISLSADRLAEWSLRNKPDADLFEIYRFVFAALLQLAAVYGTILILSACLHVFFEAVLWIAFFLAGRHWAGGAHARTRTGCFLLSVAVSLGCAVLARLLPGNVLLTGAVSLVSIVLVFVAAPSDILPGTSEKDLRRKRIWARSEIVAAAAAAVSLSAQASSWSSAAYAACFGSFSAAVSCFIAWQHERRSADSKTGAA